jgi:pre-rRNA-processing protein TSR1
MDNDIPQTLAVADPQLQETLQAENVPDTFASEQTWPTEEELKEADGKCTDIL